MNIAINVERAREQMIEQQVHAWDVFDERVLTVMRQIRRENFAPALYREVAFADSSIPLPHAQAMLPAKVHGRILQALALTPEDAALEVGAGSGYLTACMGKLAARVRSLEIFPDLAAQARANVLAAAVNNVSVEAADAMQLDEQFAYDAIAVTGSLPLYDERFQRALKNGGRLFVIVGQAPVMEAWKVTRIGEREWQRESMFETVIDPLVNAARPSGFVF
ncbi:MAG: protein-L-isoaspartate O-methyltransferase family protein [Steroidobacter sp.]